MKFCAFCGSELTTSDRYCRSCRNKVSDDSSYEVEDYISKSDTTKIVDERIRGNKFFKVFIILIFTGMVYRYLGPNDNVKVNTYTTPPIEDTIIGINVSIRFDGSQFIITNHDNFDWTNVEFDLNGGTFSSGYLLNSARIRAGETYAVGAMQFSKKNGTRFNPFSMKPQKLSISCKTPEGKMGFYYGSFN